MKIGFDEEWWMVDTYLNNPGIESQLQRKVDAGTAVYLHFHKHGEPCVYFCRDAAFDPQEHVDLKEFEKEFESPPPTQIILLEATQGHGPNCVCYLCTNPQDRKEWQE